MDAFVTREPIDRDLRRRHLAQRLIAHHARSQTIFRHTGLSRHQQATLRRRWHVPNDMRHRGPVPTSFGVFLSTQRVRDEAAALAVFWRALTSAGANNTPVKQMSMVEVGEGICDVFEAYAACFPTSALELEHVILFARGLEEADAIALSKCGNCDAVILVDLLGSKRRVCGGCQRPNPAAETLRDPPADPDTGSGTGSPVQRDLF
jgi:hypothetical protein